MQRQAAGTSPHASESGTGGLTIEEVPVCARGVLRLHALHCDVNPSAPSMPNGTVGRHVGAMRAAVCAGFQVECVHSMPQLDWPDHAPSISQHIGTTTSHLAATCMHACKHYVRMPDMKSRPAACCRLPASRPTHSGCSLLAHTLTSPRERHKPNRTAHA